MPLTAATLARVLTTSWGFHARCACAAAGLAIVLCLVLSFPPMRRQNLAGQSWACAHIVAPDITEDPWVAATAAPDGEVVRVPAGRIRVDYAAERPFWGE